LDDDEFVDGDAVDETVFLVDPTGPDAGEVAREPDVRGQSSGYALSLLLASEAAENEKSTAGEKRCLES
jgi:hypothetical protein